MTSLPESRPAQAPGELPVAELVARCQRGDDQAKAMFIVRYGEVIHHAVRRRLASGSVAPPLRGDVEDISNDIVVRLLADDCRMLARLQQPERITAWLVAVARNHVVDCLRRDSSRLRAQTYVEQEDSYPAPRTPAELAMRKESADHVRAGMKALSARDRLVVELYYLHGLKYAEIAEVMQLNINTVAVRLHRAKARLRELLTTAQQEPVTTEGPERCTP